MNSCGLLWDLCSCFCCKIRLHLKQWQQLTFSYTQHSAGLSTPTPAQFINHTDWFCRWYYSFCDWLRPSCCCDFERCLRGHKYPNSSNYSLHRLRILCCFHVVQFCSYFDFLICFANFVGILFSCQSHPNSFNISKNCYDVIEDHINFHHTLFTILKICGRWKILAFLVSYHYRNFVLVIENYYYSLPTDHY